MLRKGIYPNEYMTGVGKLCEKSLPPKEEFASLLGAGVISDLEGIITTSHISDKDYQHAFGCENLADYTVLYCKSDVLLLADICEVSSTSASAREIRAGSLPLHYRHFLVLGRHVEDDGR